MKWWIFCLPVFLTAAIQERVKIEPCDFPPNSWVFVDLDNCLMQSNQAFGHAFWFYDLLAEKLAQGISRDEAIDQLYPLWVWAQNIVDVQPVQENFVAILHDWMERGGVALGFTHRQPMLAKRTLEQIASLGLDFSTAPPLCSTDFQTDRPTLYEGGVLFAGDYHSKGDILKKFLTLTQDSPSFLVFIDDQRKNVEEVAEAAASLGIEYLGIHFRAVEVHASIYQKEKADLTYQQLQGE